MLKDCNIKCLHFFFQAGKMSKDAMIRYLRSVAGDKLLASSIKRIRGYWRKAAFARGALPRSCRTLVLLPLMKMEMELPVISNWKNFVPSSVVSNSNLHENFVQFSCYNWLGRFSLLWDRRKLHTILLVRSVMNITFWTVKWCLQLRLQFT